MIINQLINRCLCSGDQRNTLSFSFIQYTYINRVSKTRKKVLICRKKCAFLDFTVRRGAKEIRK